jgi:hypothetical protein
VDLAIFGTTMSKSSGLGGGFVPTPPGGWLVMKAFAKGGEGVFFLNLNEKAGKCEFSIKDPDCGKIVIAELAKVL